MKISLSLLGEGHITYDDNPITSRLSFRYYSVYILIMGAVVNRLHVAIDRDYQITPSVSIRFAQ